MCVARNNGKLLKTLGLVPLTNPCSENRQNDECKTKMSNFNDSKTSSDESDESISCSEKENLKFDITFTVQEWEVIQPREKLYQEKRGPKTYTIMTPYEWSNVVQDHFFLHTQLPCSLTFKKASVKPYGIVYLSVVGRCSDCGSMFKGTVDTIPASGIRVIMKCSFNGDFRVKHFHKRRLIGSQRDKALNAMMKSGIDPSVFVRNEARELMKEGDAIPAQIPNIGTLRVAKHRALAASQIHPDPLIALNKMKYLTQYENSIHDIGSDKTFVHFWSNLQLKIYRDYCKKEQIPTISFDATGGCVRKIIRGTNKRSGPIFLYEGVMNIDHRNFTVMSMLSEQHDTISISTWLKRWMRCGVKAPKVVICDQSLALMSALVQAFTEYQTLEKYLEVCFAVVVSKQNVDMPNCYLRNDVNHFVHLVSLWKEVKTSKFNRTKELITRGMGLLVLCTSIVEAENILEAIFIIILSKYDGEVLQIDTNHSESCEVIKTPCAEKKNYLAKLISCNKHQLEVLESNTELQNPEYDNEIHLEDHSFNTPISNFKHWAQLIADKAREKVENVIGVVDNAQYLPTLEPCIVKVMKLFPCWSGIMREKFGFGTETASSSRIECNFNHIKNRVFKNENMPLRIDTFLEKLISYYRGDHLLVQAENIESEIRPPLEFKPTHKTNECETYFIDELEETNGRVLFEDEKYEKDNQTDEDKSIEEVDTREDNIPSAEDKLSEKYTLRKVNDEIIEIVERAKNNTTISNQVHCDACINEDYPTGLHKCICCKKSVHMLLGCSYSIPGTKEGCGEKRICFDCDKQKSMNAEKVACEGWNKKGQATKKQRSAHSYINPQPGFELIDFNKKAYIKPVFFLKNGNSMMRPVSVPNVGKMILNNTCSVDSILSILASSAADSIHFRNYIQSVPTTNLTATIIKKMSSESDNKTIYHDRLLLLLQFFADKVECLIGGLKTINITTTVAYIVDKIMADMPSVITTSECSNNDCSNRRYEYKSTKISVNKYNEEYSIQNELDDYIIETEKECEYCGSLRNSKSSLTTHILIEINCVPLELEASTSTGNIEDVQMDMIKQNFARSNMIRLENIEKMLMVNDKLYHLRGVINFFGGERSGLRSTTGHYTASALRANGRWETYDDMKFKVNPTKTSMKTDVEFLIYTL